MRGDRPHFPVKLKQILRSSPHAWGSSLEHVRLERPERVFPTCVGIVPAASGGLATCAGLPHMRGDRPTSLCSTLTLRGSSPHAWGSSLHGVIPAVVRMVFPTCVGIVPPPRLARAVELGLPHMRGDRPCLSVARSSSIQSSPHAWGSSRAEDGTVRRGDVFPTCVGIVPPQERRHEAQAGLPHMRGDRPGNRGSRSPRDASSPHAWGSSRHSVFDLLWRPVFPTCVGIVPSTKRSSRRSRRLPHMRGDRPVPTTPDDARLLSSPHAWGSSLALAPRPPRRKVFPTCVGISSLRP